jgi:hypothetical protein
MSIIFRYTVAVLVFLIVTCSAVKITWGFEVEGSNRVPFKVQRDVNLRDAQPVRVRIVAVEDAYKHTEHTSGSTQCYHEKRAIETIDNRNFISKLINPGGGAVYENQYNCYNKPITDTMRVHVGYIVTYELYGQNYQKFVYYRPTGRYLTIMSNQG